MSQFSIDVSEIEGLAAAIGAAPEKALTGIRAVMQKGALKIKQDMQAELNAGVGAAPHSYVPHLARSVTYDTAITSHGITAEIGPDKNLDGRQGALASILAFGTSRQPAVWDHEAAARRELPTIEKFIAEIGVESL